MTVIAAHAEAISADKFITPPLLAVHELASL